MDTNIGYIISKIAYGIIPVVYKEENELDKQRMNKSNYFNKTIYY